MPKYFSFLLAWLLTVPVSGQEVMWNNLSLTHLGFGEVVLLLFLITSVAIAGIVLFEKRSPEKTVAWILALVLLPVVGLVFYLIFGQEYRKTKLVAIAFAQFAFPLWFQDQRKMGKPGF